MIFVTVGAQMPFDRMVRAIDAWAATAKRSDVFAQIGPSDWKPAHIGWAQFLQPDEFREKVEKAAVIVAHAGMGSILTALELGKRIIVMPRRGDLRETRNDHQLATASRLQQQGRVSVAWNQEELLSVMENIEQLVVSERISPHASPQLLETIRGFIDDASNRTVACAHGSPDPEMASALAPRRTFRGACMQWLGRRA